MKLEKKDKNYSNVVLVGFMGAGKSTVGRLLAQITNKKFFDTDDIIEEKYGMDIPAIFDLKGEVFFRNEERKVIQELLLNEKNAVIATGGGLPCHHELMRFINKHATTVYLLLGFKKIWERIKEDQNRPLLQSKSIKSKYKIEQLFRCRRPIYLQAQIKVRAFNEPNRIVDCIITRIKKLDRGA